METYKIEPLALDKFINDKNYKLPRYQRKDTWKKDQYFKLCISLFQGYPIGVSIVNSKDGTYWLLDGRQRRTCLKKLAEEPVTVYEWARKFCKFKFSSDELEVKEKFYYEVKKYLGSDIDEEEQAENKESDEEEAIDNIPDFEESNEIFKNLSKLLDYILMVHPGNTSDNAWFKAFNFKDFFRPKPISYLQQNINNPSQYCINQAELCKFIRDTYDEVYDKELHCLSIDKFIIYIENKWEFKGEEGTPEWKKNKKNFEHKVLNEVKDKILASYSAINELDNVLSNARIGMIYLSNASTLDAQNIFSRINKEGTQLSASELLSAKPYWNIRVNLNSIDKQRVRILYKKLNIDFDEQGVRWDIPATLISRIDSKYHLFYHYSNTEDNEIKFDVNEITTGFKLLSACKVKGISKIALDKLEDPGILNWEDNLETYIDQMRQMIATIYAKLPEFQTLILWNKNIHKLLGDAPTFELLAIAYDFYSKFQDDMIEGNTRLKEFISHIKNHFDRLVFEKVTGKWKGSSDSLFARNTSDLYISSRTAPLSIEENQAWERMIESAIAGRIDNQEAKQENMEVLLYYSKMLSQEQPWTGDTQFDIDHIYPQTNFRSNGNINQTLCNALGNLAILPKQVNESKKEKSLKFIKDEIKQKVSYYEKIQSSDFEKYSQPENIEKLLKERGNSYKQILINSRISYLKKS